MRTDRLENRHTPRIAERLDQLILDQGDLDLTRAWFRCVHSEKLTLALYPVFAEVMEREGFVHPAAWLKSLKEPG